MAFVTEKWSTQQYGPERARREFEVSGVGSIIEAINAVGIGKGATHPSDTALIAEAPVGGRAGFGLYSVTIDYSIPTGGDSSSGGGGDPLAAVARIRWGRASLSEPTDIDIHGNKIRNAAGDGFTPKLSRTFTSRTFTIVKNLATYPFDLAGQFEEKVNADYWTVANSTVVFPQYSVKCLSIMPDGEYTADATYVAVAFSFEVRLTGGRNPFQPRAVNQGRNGWYSDTSVSPAVTKYGAITRKDSSGVFIQVSEDVLLDSTGKPIDSTLTVEGKSPLANPNAVSGYTLDSDAPGPALIMVWSTVDAISFAGLSSYI
jgi:hypothetical protein